METLWWRAFGDEVNRFGLVLSSLLSQILSLLIDQKGVLARCVIDAGARIKVDTWSRRDRSRQRDNIALLSVFFVLIAYSILRYATQRSLSKELTHEHASPYIFFLAAYMHISDRYVDICILKCNLLYLWLATRVQFARVPCWCTHFSENVFIILITG